MASTYSSNLRLELIAAGEQAGTWGNTTNRNLGTLLEESICGSASVSVTSGNASLTYTDGQTCSARKMILTVTGTPGTTRTVTIPSVSKVYLVTNSSDSSATFTTGSGATLTIPASAGKVIYCDGTNVYDALVITGAASTIYDSNLTASRALIANASGKVAVSAVTATELGYLSGVSSAVQTQINSKQATITGAATTITTDPLTVSRALASDASGKVAVSSVTSTELGYMSGVTSAVQTQLDSKLPLAGGTMTGMITLPATSPTGTQAASASFVNGKTITAGAGLSGGGTLASTVTLALAAPTGSALGGVKAGTGISIAADGTISATGTSGVTSIAVSTNPAGALTTSGSTGAITLTFNGTSFLTTSAASTTYFPKTGGAISGNTSVTGNFTASTYVQANTSLLAGTFVQASSYVLAGTYLECTGNESAPAIRINTTGNSTDKSRIYNQYYASFAKTCAVFESVGGAVSEYNPILFTQVGSSLTQNIRASIGKEGVFNVYGDGSNNAANYGLVAGNASIAKSIKAFGNVEATGTVTAGGAKPFRIPHPTLDNTTLYHASIEGPKVDLLYRGTVALVAGCATVLIDEASNMTPGTFEALTQNAEVVSLFNKDGFTRLRASEVLDGAFTIFAEDANCMDRVTWVVMAERADDNIKASNITDELGRLVPEHPAIEA